MTSLALFASRKAEVAQAIYFFTLLTFIINLKAFMALTIRLILRGEISPTVKESCPKRMGTRTKELFMYLGEAPGETTTLEIKTRTAFEPISIAA